MFLQMALFHFLWLSNSPLWASWWLSSQESVCQCQRCIGRRSPGEGNDNPPQYSCLGNPTDRGAWRATVHGVAKSQTQLSDWAHTVFRYTAHLLYLFSCWWTCRLLPCLGNCKQRCCDTLGCVYPFKLKFASFLDICPGVGLVNHMVTVILVFWGTSEEPPYSFL